MNKTFSSISFVRFSIKEQTLFAKRLSFLIKAGVPLIECLHLIRKQTKSKVKIKIYDCGHQRYCERSILSNEFGISTEKSLATLPSTSSALARKAVS
jgi:type II secretory pathway component PulF